MAMQPVGGGDAADHPYTPVGTQQTWRRNGDGTFTAVRNITAQSTLYGVQFTFTILEDTWQKGGAPPLIAERTAWVDQIAGHAHVQDFYSEQDEGPSQVQYNYGVIVVGTDDGALENPVRVRMDHLNDQSTFAAIDRAWKQLEAIGAK